MTAEGSLLYQHLLNITQDYLGPAAERFLMRQIMTHLRKSPESITKTDLQTLAIRIRSGLLVLTRDEAVVDEAYLRIAAIADQ